MPDLTADAFGLPFDSADYELRWPRQLFVRELRALRAISRAEHQTPRIELLLEEAFLGSTPLQDYRDFAPTFGLGTDDVWPPPEPRDYVDDLLAVAPRLREHRAPRPYWSARRGTGSAPTRRSLPELRADFAREVATLHASGYLDRALPTVCGDDRDGVEIDPNSVLFERLGIPELWPLEPDQWAEDTFFDLIEVFHDLVARPRYRRYHDFNSCGWHYSDFATDIGRALYRSKINQLLSSGGSELALADRGEDIGRLVHTVDDARGDLIERASATPELDARGRIEHAIALFRGRAATQHDKRSAIVALATVLEDRKRLLKSSLFTDDDSALFHIANKFDLRHANDKQHTDYNPAFRDWVFWWYLATIELTDRLASDQATLTSS